MCGPVTSWRVRMTADTISLETYSRILQRIGTSSSLTLRVPIYVAQGPVGGVAEKPNNQQLSISYVEYSKRLFGSLPSRIQLDVCRQLLESLTRLYSPGSLDTVRLRQLVYGYETSPNFNLQTLWKDGIPVYIECHLVLTGGKKEVVPILVSQLQWQNNGAREYGL